jgi:hypothetical protein
MEVSADGEMNQIKKSEKSHRRKLKVKENGKQVKRKQFSLNHLFC